jgi:hypothetical protein
MEGLTVKSEEQELQVRKERCQHDRYQSDIHYQYVAHSRFMPLLTLQQVVKQRRRPPLRNSVPDKLARPAEKLYKECELHAPYPLEGSGKRLSG